MADLSIDEFGNPTWQPGQGGGSLMDDRAAPAPTPEEMALAAIQNTPLPNPANNLGIPPPPGAGTPPTPGDPSAALMLPSGQFGAPPPVNAPGMQPSLLAPPGGPVMAQPGAGMAPTAQPSNPYAAPTMQPQDPYARPSTGVGSPPVPVELGARGAQLPAGGQPLRSGDVSGAAVQQNQALSDAMMTRMGAGSAELDAKADIAARRAAIIQQHTDEQLKADAAFAQQRAVARKDAERETAEWMAGMEKKAREEPSPSRWFENQNTFGKIMWMLSLAFGAMAQAKAPGMKNIGLEMINAEIDADIGRQKARLERELEAIKKRGAGIDQKLANRLADAKDDHTLLSSRLLMLQNAALERASAPGAKEQQAVWMSAANWAAEKRLEVADQRVQRAYAEREGKLNRDAENWRAQLSDQRTRAISLMENQRAYDLAQMQVSAKVSEGTGAKFKDTRVLHPGITGIRVVGPDGKPVQNQASSTGGLVVSEKVEKDAITTAQTAQERYATLKRVSKALEADDDLGVLLKRNPQLVADIQSMGYQVAKEADPRGIVTDKDLSNGLEMALGGDLSSLSGRIASGTFSAGQTKLKDVVDKYIRDMPKKISNRMGALLDASIPGYEGEGVRVDWTPKQVEIDEPTTPTPRQVDAKYGISKPIAAPNTISELEAAQALENKGMQALPPYKPGVQEKVTEVLSDLKGLLPDKVNQRAEAAKQLVQGDQRAVMEIEQARVKESKKAQERLDEFASHLKANFQSKASTSGVTYTGSEMVEIGSKLAKKYGLGQLSGDEIVSLMKSLNVPTTDWTSGQARSSKPVPFK